jgi:hypothetical protein
MTVAARDIAQPVGTVQDAWLLGVGRSLDAALLAHCPGADALALDAVGDGVLATERAINRAELESLRPMLVEAAADTSPERRRATIASLLQRERDRLDRRADGLLARALSMLDVYGIDAAPSTLLEADAGPASFNADGTLNVVVMRPCHGRGQANAIYPADVLARDAGVFAGLPMHRGHRSGELVGLLLEARWDPAFRGARDARYGFRRGAVIGRAEVTEDLAAEVREDPGALEVSAHVHARSLSLTAAGVWGPGFVVGGLDADPERHAVDFVPAGGAGGEVLREGWQ